MKTDIKTLLEFAGVDTTQGEAKKLVEMRAGHIKREQPTILDKDDGEVNEKALEKLFSKKVDVEFDDLEKWEQAGLGVIHIDDQMGNDTIFHVNGNFVHWDRHTGTATAAPKGTTEDSILDTIRIDKD